MPLNSCPNCPNSYLCFRNIPGCLKPQNRIQASVISSCYLPQRKKRFSGKREKQLLLAQTNETVFRQAKKTIVACLKCEIDCQASFSACPAGDSESQASKKGDKCLPDRKKQIPGMQKEQKTLAQSARIIARQAEREAVACSKSICGFQASKDGCADDTILHLQLFLPRKAI